MSQTENHSDNIEYNPPPYKKSNSLVMRILLGVAAVLLIIFLMLSQIFAWGRVNALERRGSQTDCLALYRNDVSTAIGMALAANNKLWVAAAVRDPNLTDEQRAADNQRLGHELEAANAPLVAATQALDAYDSMNPKPEQCPHAGENDGDAG